MCKYVSNISCLINSAKSKSDFCSTSLSFGGLFPQWEKSKTTSLYNKGPKDLLFRKYSLQVEDYSTLRSMILFTIKTNYLLI